MVNSNRQKKFSRLVAVRHVNILSIYGRSGYRFFSFNILQKGEGLNTFSLFCAEVGASRSRSNGG